MKEKDHNTPTQESKHEKVVNKSLHNIGDPEILDKLTNAKGEHLQALLVSLFASRVDNLKSSDVIRSFRQNRFVTPSSVSLSDIMSFDGMLLDLLPDDFTAIEFSPVAPIGMNSVFTKIDPKNTLATIRNTEVVSDASILLVLEYLNRRKNKQTDGPVHLMTSHRVLRAQKFDIPGFSPHFRACFLLSSDKFQGQWEKVGQFLKEHISVYLDLLDASIKSEKFEVKGIKVALSNIMILEYLIGELGLDREIIMENTQNKDFSTFDYFGVRLPKVINPYTNEDMAIEDTDPLSASVNKAIFYLKRNTDTLIKDLHVKYPHVEFIYDLERPAGIGYYTDICFKISAETVDGEVYPLADGGFTDWTKLAMQSEKEMCLSSGFGTELFISKFKRL